LFEALKYFHAGFKISLLQVVAVLPNLLSTDVTNNTAEAFVRYYLRAKWTWMDEEQEKGYEW